MLYEDLMMDTSMKIRYSMLRLLTTLSDDHYSIFFIAQKLNLTYQQAYHHLNELNREIQQVNDEQGSILIKNSGIDADKLVLSLDEYRYFLLQESIPFRFIQYILNHEHPSLDEFCDEMFISRSTLSRKIKALTEFLRNYNIRISYTTMSLVGNETKIRLVLFYLMWLGTRGLIWPFTFSEKSLEYFDQHFTKYFSLSGTFMGRKELQYFYAITQARINRGFYTEYNPHYDFLFEDSSYYDLTLMKDHPKITPLRTKGETAFMYFLSLFAPYFSEKDDPVLKSTLEEFTKSDNVVWNLSTQFIEYLNKHLFSEPLSKDEEEVFLGNLLHTTFSYFAFDKPFPNMRSFVVSEKSEPMSSLLVKTCNDFFDEKLLQKEFLLFKKSLPDLNNAYKELAEPYYSARQKTTHLNVALAIEQNHLFTQQLTTFLDNLNFVHFESFLDEPDKYDLIISSSFAIKKEFPEVAFYYWDLDYDYDELIYLYQKLRQLYVAKNR